MKKTALIIVDVLNGAFKGVFESERTRSVVAPIKSLVDFARENDMPIVYANDAHIAGVDQELEHWGDHALVGSEDAQVIPEIAPQEGDFVIPKRRFNSFFQTDLQLLLTELGIERVIVTGLLIEICVLHTATEAYNWGYELVIPSDCTNALDQENYDYMIHYFKRVLGAAIPTAQEWIESQA